MKKYCFFLLLLPVLAAAQCPEDPAQHIGGYVKNPATMDGVGPFGRKNIAQINARLDAIATLLRQALPQPKGCTLNWRPMPYETFKLTTLHNSYYADWFVQPYFCDKAAHKLLLDETPLSPIFTINGIDNRIFRRVTEIRYYTPRDKPLPLLINGKPMLELPPRATQPLPAGQLYRVDNGCRRFGNQNSTVDVCGVNLVVITTPGKELFVPVTRGQYLDYLVAMTQDDFNHFVQRPYEEVDHGYYPTRGPWEEAVKKSKDERDAKLNRLIAYRDHMSSSERQLPA
ncbi:MAG TPA: hypothetical protein VLD19_12855, partial [Chitinophagaceae bacterium]|nr:hypothetical protein [Chitinophagaceae bacterium]